MARALLSSGLQRRLLLMLLLPLAVLALLNTWFDYRSADNAALQQDRQLLRLVPLLADSIVAKGKTGSDPPVMLTAPAVQEFLRERAGVSAFGIVGLDGTLLLGDPWLSAAAPTTKEPAFTSEEEGGVTYRIVSQRVSTGPSEATTRLMLQLELVGPTRLTLADGVATTKRLAVQGPSTRLTASGASVPLGPGQRLVVSGQANASSQAGRFELTGQLRADEGLIELRGGDAPSLPADVEIIGRSRAAAGNGQAGAAPNGLAAARPGADTSLHIASDLTLDLGEKLRVRGSGVDARLTGTVNLRGALEQSCNCYFIALGQLLGAVETTVALSRAPSAPLTRASFALRVVPGEFPARYSSVVFNMARAANEQVPRSERSPGPPAWSGPGSTASTRSFSIGSGWPSIQETSRSAISADQTMPRAPKPCTHHKPGWRGKADRRGLPLMRVKSGSGPTIGMRSGDIGRRPTRPLKLTGY